MKIFLGYPSEHLEIASKVYEYLLSCGDEVWFDKKSLIPGTDWDRERDLGQREAELVIHLCSKSMLSRPGVVNREIRRTLQLVEDQPLGALYVIPIRLEPIKLPVELTRFQYFDFGEDWKERLREGVEKRRTQLSGEAIQTQKPDVISKSFLGAQKIEFEDITKTYECRGEYLRYGEDGRYWTYVNGAISTAALEGFFGARRDFKYLYPEENDARQEDDQKDEWSLNMEEFFRKNDMLSIRCYSYIGFAHAAHPNHYITTLNFFGEESGSLTNSPIVRILIGSRTESDLILRKNHCCGVRRRNCQNTPSLTVTKIVMDNLWKLLAQFGFDQKGLTFNFSPYDVLPYVFGSHEVLVPWHFLEGSITEDYKPIIDKLSK